MIFPGVCEAYKWLWPNCPHYKYGESDGIHTHVSIIMLSVEFVHDSVLLIRLSQ